MKSPFFVNAGRVISEFSNIFPIKKNNFRILTYHSIGDHVPLDKMGIYNLTKNKFYTQMKYLHDNNIKISPLSEFSNLSITFDDGFLNNYLTAFPILNNFNFPFTIFITPKFIDNYLYLNRSQLKELSTFPNVTIGAHGFTHRHLGHLNYKETYEELINSKKWIENLIGKEVNHFSYPFGSYNNDTMTLLRENNYLSSCTVNFGTNYDKCNLYELKRTDIFSFDTLRDFKLKINGAWDWIEFRTKRHKT